jgi:hypothetical protein
LKFDLNYFKIISCIPQSFINTEYYEDLKSKYKNALTFKHDWMSIDPKDTKNLTEYFNIKFLHWYHEQQ